MKKIMTVIALSTALFATSAFASTGMGMNENAIYLPGITDISTADSKLPAKILLSKKKKVKVKIKCKDCTVNVS